MHFLKKSSEKKIKNRFDTQKKHFFCDKIRIKELGLGTASNK